MWDGTPDRRQARRYPVRLQVDLPSEQGVTRDVSASGVYFLTRRPPAIGESIAFSLLLSHAYPGPPFRVHCQADVLRVEPRDGEVGVAAAITSLWFQHPVPEGEAAGMNPARDATISQ